MNLFKNILGKKIIRIFLASSAELEEDIIGFSKCINNINSLWTGKYVCIELKTWRDFISAHLDSRTQDSYNSYIRSCDIVVILFHTKIGRYTNEEYNTALNAYKQQRKNPLVYTYFKEPIETKDVIDFKNNLESQEIFYETYRNYDELGNKFLTQLELLSQKGIIAPNAIDISRVLKHALYFVFIPLAILLLAFYIVYYSTPQTLTVRVTETQQHSLPFNGADITFLYADKSEVLHLNSPNDEVIFKEIHAKHIGRKAKIVFHSIGYQQIDTVFKLSKELLLPIRRDNTYGIIFGTVRTVQGVPVAEATVTTEEFVTETNANGQFEIRIPIERQKESQRLTVTKEGYELWDNRGTPSDKYSWEILLKRK